MQKNSDFLKRGLKSYIMPRSKLDLSLLQSQIFEKSSFGGYFKFQ